MTAIEIVVHYIGRPSRDRRSYNSIVINLIHACVIFMLNQFRHVPLPMIPETKEKMDVALTHSEDSKSSRVRSFRRQAWKRVRQWRAYRLHCFPNAVRATLHSSLDCYCLTVTCLLAVQNDTAQSETLVSHAARKCAGRSSRRLEDNIEMDLKIFWEVVQAFTYSRITTRMGLLLTWKLVRFS